MPASPGIPQSETAMAPIGTIVPFVAEGPPQPTGATAMILLSSVRLMKHFFGGPALAVAHVVLASGAHSD
jgi:hypothetical protein